MRRVAVVFILLLAAQSAASCQDQDIRIENVGAEIGFCRRFSQDDAFATLDMKIVRWRAFWNLDDSSMTDFEFLIPRTAASPFSWGFSMMPSEQPTEIELLSRPSTGVRAEIFGLLDYQSDNIWLQLFYPAAKHSGGRDWPTIVQFGYLKVGQMRIAGGQLRPLVSGYYHTELGAHFGAGISWQRGPISLQWSSGGTLADIKYSFDFATR